MDEQLIEFVRSREELYNFADKRYSDNAHKQKLWKELAEELQKTPEYCKKRWESIRAQFRKVCRLRKTTTGQAAENAKKWKYEHNLSFLLPYMKDKGRLTSLDNVHDLSDDEDLGDDETIIAENTQMSNASISHIENSPSISGSSRSTSLQNRTRSRTTGGKNRRADPGTAGSTLMKYIIDQKKNEQEYQEKDPLYHFFEGIKKTVTTFSPRDIHLAKTKIFNVVSEIEAKYLNNENHSEGAQPQYQTLVSIPLTAPPYIFENPSDSNTTSCSSFYEPFSPN